MATLGPANERRNLPPATQDHDDDEEMRDEDDQFDQGRVSWPIQTERQRDIGESQPEHGDANYAARPGLDGAGGFAGQHEEARLRSPARGKRPHYAHHGPADDVGIDQSED